MDLKRFFHFRIETPPAFDVTAAAEHQKGLPDNPRQVEQEKPAVFSVRKFDSNGWNISASEKRCVDATNHSAGATFLSPGEHLFPQTRPDTTRGSY
ncbi:MAG TPA: hypothetical protein VN495_03405 [Candidatus Paceibacterota bacterium]|nr:hypothetical protein [Candidatus Paceibacterota bacterium]